ncbi:MULTISPECIES: DUF421 domain-containing protein [Sinorhizobium]|uniref:DUF421 domain-containing protein n=1 Tax=Sinorhizobium psoraleae TaxID=520838 RepID=A0ABT4KQA6_9HYPH|nr:MULTISPECIES: YetF domain-containing protein [Sinorhizobium]MCZ4094048.1 DUF421 domain-containing protein [Sinorhizobium psoraleae]MDK1385880.1 DUF421 domain-containing protein [Sinorhizobium sp. 7-81]NRP73006.1 hypothetical protein [Sinorhizobium psoraleae]
MESVARGAAIYFILLIVLRLSGRRTVAQMTTFDFVLLLIIAETTQQALLGEDFSITNATVLILTLFGLDILLSYVKRSMPKVALLLDGTPTVLIAEGKIDTHALKRARVDLEEVLAAAREQHGLARLDQIRFAILEADGGISIVPQ